MSSLQCSLLRRILPVAVANVMPESFRSSLSVFRRILDHGRSLRNLSAQRFMSSSTTLSLPPNLPPSFLIFGCNTDIGKTVLTAGMIRSAARPFQSSPSASAIVAATHSVTNATHYIKPLQSGGSDERFVRKHCRFDGQDDTFLKTARTLFRWETPSSPHLAARIEKKPISDKEVLEKLNHHLNDLASQSKTSNTSTASSIWIETAGGVLSPAASSPLNTSSKHASSPPSSSHLSSASWGWMPQADLYLQLLMSGSSSSSLKNDENIGQLKKDKMIQVVLIGDGRLGGISATLSSLEALVSRRHYTIAGIVQICAGDHTTSGTMQHENDTNQEALKEYTWSMSNLLRSQIENQNLDPLWIDPDSSIVSVPALPPEPEPLTDWYDSSDVTSVLDNFVHGHLFRHAQSHIKN